MLESTRTAVSINRLMKTCDNHESSDTSSLDVGDYWVSAGHFGRYLGDLDDFVTGTFPFEIDQNIRDRRVRIVNGMINVYHLAVDLYDVRDSGRIASFPPLVANAIHYLWMVVSTEISPASVNQLAKLMDRLCTSAICRCDHVGLEVYYECAQCLFRFVIYFY